MINGLTQTDSCGCQPRNAPSVFGLNSHCCAFFVRNRKSVSGSVTIQLPSDRILPNLDFPIDLAANGRAELFISDRNNQRVRKVTFLDGPTLTINSVGTNDLGDYSLIISGAFGTITSSIVTLKISSQPPDIRLESIGFTSASGPFGFAVKGPPGQAVVVEASALLPDNGWQTLSIINLDSEGSLLFLDPAWAEQPARFYRTRVP